jgi:hypothetical protein
VVNRKLKIRLFQCSNSKGVFKVIEVPYFSQDDLDNEDIMMLDTYSVVFLWVGNRSSEVEKRMSVDVALEYAAYDKSRGECQVFAVQAGMEPPEFTCHFHGWDHKKAEVITL